MVQGVAIVDGCIVNTNPATGEEISRVPCTSLDQLEVMLQAARQAQPQWARVPLEQRILYLKDGLKELHGLQDRLVPLIVREMGKPLSEARKEMEGAVNRDDYFDVMQQALQTQRRGTCLVVRQALGVVVVLSPWNFPADEILLLTLPALASGNAVIVKPSEVTPETGKLVVDALASVLPTNVLQLAQGDGTVGSHLVSHKAVDMVAMTGSSATGRKIAESVAPQLKRLVLELGGKDPMIVFEDADLDLAARDAVAYSLSNSGQVCCSTERIFVAQSIYEDFLTRVASLAASYRLGDGMQSDVHVGPMVSAVQRDIVKEQVHDAIAKGARLLYETPNVPSIGNFYPITVLADVREDMKLFRQETFGPVVSVTAFDGTEDEAVRLANDTEYGLASSVYTSDRGKAERVGNSIQAGQVGINCYPIECMDVACPWVGHKQSGYGYHSGIEGFQQFSVPKTIVFTSPEDV